MKLKEERTNILKMQQVQRQKRAYDKIKVKPNCQSSVRVGWSCQFDLGWVLTKNFIMGEM